MNSTIRFYDSNCAWLAKDYEKLDPNWLAPFEPPRFSKILDVGAGSGRDAAWLAAKGHTVMAFEPSEGMQEEAKKYHPDSEIHWFDSKLPSPALYMKMAARGLDMVYKCDLIIVSCVTHALSPGEISASMSDLTGGFLADDGKLVFSELVGDDNPDKGHYLAKLEPYCEAAGLTMPEYFYHPEPNGYNGATTRESALMRKLK